jgi:hypothetical protein
MSSVQNSRCQEVQAAWEKIRETFEWFPPQEEEKGADQVLHKFMEDLATSFTRYFSQQEVTERLALPEDYRCFLQFCSGGYWRRDGEYGLYLYGRGAGAATEFAADRPPNAGMWLEFGHWSDRHEIMLCCDRQLPLFGAVVDFNDDHPWLTSGDFNTRGTPEVYVEAANFLEYLQSLDEEEPDWEA